MGLFDRFRRRDEDDGIDPLKDLVLEKLRVGYLVDYDLKTWTVTAHNRYRFNDGRTAEEWELTAGREKRYLELSRGDEEAWTLSKSIPIGAVGPGNVRQHLLEHEDPPDQLTYRDVTYYMEGSVGGHLLPGDGEGRQELIVWEYVDDDEESFVSIVQWSETEVTAVAGTFVEDYQFTNILPGEAT